MGIYIYIYSKMIHGKKKCFVLFVFVCLFVCLYFIFVLFFAQIYGNDNILAIAQKSELTNHNKEITSI